MGECLMTRPPDQINTMPYYVHTTSLDFNSDEAKKHGFHIIAAAPKNGPVANWGTLFVDALCGSPYQLYIPDGSSATLYKRALTSTTWNSIESSTSTPQIETGSYAGTTGESLTLTFQKKPYIVLIQGNGIHTTAVCIYGATTTKYGYASYETDEWSTSIAALSWGAKSLTLSNGSYSPSEKFYTSLNYSGKTYAYIAITM